MKAARLLLSLLLAAYALVGATCSFIAKELTHERTNKPTAAVRVPTSDH